MEIDHRQMRVQLTCKYRIENFNSFSNCTKYGRNREKHVTKPLTHVRNYFYIQLFYLSFDKIDDEVRT